MDYFIQIIKDFQFWIIVIIFLSVFVAFITEIVDKWVATTLGVLLYFILGFVKPNEIVGFINFDTILMLLGMNILLEVVTGSGLFDLLAAKILEFTRKDPTKIFLFLMLTCLFFGSFLYSITGLLLLLPLSIKIAREINFSPKLFILGEIFFMNLGGALTMIGDPVSTIIGTTAKFSMSQFILTTTLPVFIITAFVLALLYFLNRDSFGGVYEK